MKLFQIPKFSTLQYSLNIEVKGSLLILLRFNPVNAKFNPICHLLALLGADHILHISGLRVNWFVSLSYEDIFNLQFYFDVH